MENNSNTLDKPTSNSVAKRSASKATQKTGKPQPAKEKKTMTAAKKMSATAQPEVKSEKENKLDKKALKAEAIKTKVKVVEHDVDELTKVACEVEIRLVGLIKNGADRKVKKTLKGQLKKIVKNIQAKNKKKEKLNKRVEKREKAVEKLRKAISNKAS